MAAPSPKTFHIPNPIPPVVHGVENTVKGAENVAKTTVSVGNFLTDPVRMGEALVGLMLIGVGINAMLKGGSVTSATKKSAGTAANLGVMAVTKGKSAGAK